jgi:long-chain alkane monooxygenase
VNVTRNRAGAGSSGWTGCPGLARRDLLSDWPRSWAWSQRIVGTPDQIADELQEWADAGIDGVNVMGRKKDPGP